MLDVVLESARALAMCVIFGFLLVAGRRHGLRRQKGWSFIAWGFGLLLFGSLLDVTDNFEGLSRLVVFGDTEVQAFLEKVVGYLLGFALLAVGFAFWLPLVGTLNTAEQRLMRHNDQLEGEVAQRTASTREASEDLRESKARLEHVSRIAGLGHWVWDEAEGRMSYCSEELLKIYGLPPGSDHFSRRSCLDIVHSGDRERVDSVVNAASARAGDYQIEYRILRPDGEVRVVQERGAPWFDESGALVKTIGAVQDITERQAYQEELKRRALYDSLTGLPNRTLLVDRLAHGIEIARRERRPLALLLLDLDRFKEINDTLGHQVGDRLLKEVARRFRKTLRKADTVARFGGDEFLILLPAVTDLDRARRVAARLHKTLDRSFNLSGMSFAIGASIGIALYPEHAETAGELMQCADVAMYMAKKGPSGVAVYDSAKDHNSLRHLALSGELRQAIETDQLSFHYQPKIDLRRRRVCGVEALVRWQHPKQGAIPPDEFVSQAERTGLIQKLTHWGLNEAIRQLAGWRALGLDLGLAVNLSAANLLQDSLPDLIEDFLGTWEVAPGHLTLEITENAIMVDPERALEVAKRLNAIGVRLSIDDFGTGYSSLAYIKRLPVDELKVDKSFVMQMDEDKNDAVIVRSTIELAHSLGLVVVAEGIEKDVHIELLDKLACDVGQGFFISHPLPPDQLIRWLGETDWWPDTPDEDEAPPPSARKAG
jgi:diguanylate cyclase (GGDEF)-like protein/PAS domain S-box-containing protein